MIQTGPSLRNFPKVVGDLAGMVLEVECLNPSCQRRRTRLYPLPGRVPLDPQLSMAGVLRRCSCVYCRTRPDYLILYLEGRNEKGHRNRHTPQWLFGRDGVWLEASSKPIDADWFWGRQEMMRNVQERRR